MYQKWKVQRDGALKKGDISHWFFTIYSIIFFFFFGYFSIYSGSPTGQLIFVWSINYVWTRVPLFCSERSMLVFTIYVPKLSFSVCLSLSLSSYLSPWTVGDFLFWCALHSQKMCQVVESDFTRELCFCVIIFTFTSFSRWIQ